MNRHKRSPLLSARVNWIFLEILIIFSATIAYSVIIWIDESKTSESVLETLKVTVKESVPFFHYTVIIVIGTFEIIGEIMIRYTLIRDKLIKQGREEGIEQGREQGIEQGREQGIEQGREQGRINEKRTDVLKIVQYRFAEKSDTVLNEITDINDLVHLDELFDQVLSAETFEEIDFSKNGK